MSLIHNLQSHQQQVHRVSIRRVNERCSANVRETPYSKQTSILNERVIFDEDHGESLSEQLILAGLIVN